MIEVFLLAVSMADVQKAMRTIDEFCRILKCPKPVVVSIVPDEKLHAHGGRTRKIVNGGGCSIEIKQESLYHIDWLAHEVCHCVNDYGMLDEKGWLVSVTRVERIKRENEAMKCSQELIEKWHLQGKSALVYPAPK